MTVEQLWDKTWRIVAGFETAQVEFLDAVNETTEQIFNYLWKRKADLIIKPLSLQAVVVDATGAWLALPHDLRGLSERPRVAGALKQLDPALEEDRTRLSVTTGKPTHYELIGGQLYLYPVPDDETITVTGRYFKAPGAVSSFSESLPYEGMFDGTYRTILLAIASSGITPDLTPILDKNIGELLAVRDYHAPTRRRIRDF